MFEARERRLGGFCLLYLALSIPLYAATGHFVFRWFAWNLLLACLPLVFTTLARFVRRRGARLLWIAPLLLWLAFFPNAPYLLTDLIHITAFTYYQTAGYARDLFAWGALAYIACGTGLGLLAGLFSLDTVLRGARRAWGRAPAAATLAGVAVLSGYAIYIGRFLRFNSWDLFQPLPLVRRLTQDFGPFTMQFSLLAAGCIVLSYLMYDLLWIPEKRSEL